MSKTILKVSKDSKGVYINKIEASFQDLFGLIPVLVQSMAEVSEIEYNDILDDLKIMDKETKEEE